MKKSKLIDLLSSFSKAEFKSFRDFIASPYFNKREELIPFYDYLLKYAPTFAENKVDRRKVYKALHPDIPYNEKELGYLMSYTTKLVEQFISLQKYEQDDIFPVYYLLTSLNERKLNKYYKQEDKKASSKAKLPVKKNGNYYYKQHLLSDVASQHFLSQNQRKQDSNLQLASDYLDLFYLTTKLKYSCEMINNNIVLGTSYDPKIVGVLEKAMNNFSVDEEPIIAIYNLIYNILNEKEPDTNFIALRGAIQKDISTLNVEDAHEIYQYAINICLRMIRKGKKEYVQSAFELYLEGINQEIFFDKGYLSPWAYTNVIKLGLILKRYEWIEKFIHEKNEKLPESFRENAMHYNLAELYYSTKKFDKAVYHLNFVKFSDLVIHLGSREILAKIYYETDEDDALLSLIASFSIFLKRNKNMSANLKKPYLNFCDLLNQLMRKNPKKMLMIREKILTTSPLASKSWLINVSNNLLKEFKIKLPETEKT